MGIEPKISARQEEEDHVKVAVRCRPLSQQELQQGHRTIVEADEHGKCVAVAHPDNQNQPQKCYLFDELFGPNATQATVYNSLCRPIVENVLKGYNGTIFAYGQTGTGKTYTMSGAGGEGQADGVTQNAFAHIFDHIAKCHQDKRFLVRISYMEIYNEEVRDLLAKQSAAGAQRLDIKERADIGVYVRDLLNVTVASAEQCLRIMQLGNANRHTGRTCMNEQSSRSHAIFTVTVECAETVKAADGRQLLTQGKLHLVDLAGSERQSKTNATGDRLKEASKINLSLSTLGNVISALADAKSPHIPYRNSKLTRILQDSLGGNSKTAMIANIGPSSYNYEETISTLRYACRAKQIRNIARINEDPKDALLRRFQEEIEQLRKQLEENAEAISDTEAENETDDKKKNKTDEEAEGPTDEEQRKKQQQKQLERIREIEQSIERGKRKLQEEHGLKEAERRKLAEDLLRREEELSRNKRERDKLLQKLGTIERQIIVGGENMLEKVELQAQLLEQSNRALERARQEELAMETRFRTQQAEQCDIEEQYSTLQEEAQGMSKRLKKVWTQYMQAKAELKDIEVDHQREMEALLESVRQLQRELLYSMLVIDQFIPEERVRYIEKFVHWNEEIGDWQLRCVAYAGNNIREHRNMIHSSTANFPQKSQDPQMKPLFLSYADVLGLPSTSTVSSSASSASTSFSASVKPNFRPKSAAKDRNAARIRALLE
ncbi:hypothetical protein niasHT_023759 [Heterodera trifolii]|uniref:Kinesin-like protein n=1 Tax=Heterodera trifolii TaxID=157864 RepID=A0ABD2JNQ2_9BILA